MCTDYWTARAEMDEKYNGGYRRTIYQSSGVYLSLSSLITCLQESVQTLYATTTFMVYLFYFKLVWGGCSVFGLRFLNFGFDNSVIGN